MDWLVEPVPGTYVDVAVIMSHPDDAELMVGGILLQLAHQTVPVGLVDLSRGESGTRGTPAARRDEAIAAMALLPHACRVNLGLPDGALDDIMEYRIAVARTIARLKPRVVIVHHPGDPHPDHVHAHRLALSAIYQANHPKILPKGIPPHRVEYVYAAGTASLTHPDVVVDITAQWERKMALLRCYGSQFPWATGSLDDDDAPPTRISTQDFADGVVSGHRHLGARTGCTYAEGLCAIHHPVYVSNALSLLRSS